MIRRSSELGTSAMARVARGRATSGPQTGRLATLEQLAKLVRLATIVQLATIEPLAKIAQSR